ncbi:MAG: hypothetical protein HZC41_04425 [Chloroflexi bacterium]|nr:hypothetical protein [Chloroflexota bacterium]
MPALDQCHQQIVHALQKDGWQVQEAPYILPVTRTRRLFIDIQAKREQQNGRQNIIVVEAKCFLNMETELNDLYTAIGQYLIYRSLLRQKGLMEELYLAVPFHAFSGVFQQLAMEVVNEIRVKMIVVDLDGEVIAEWLA